MKACQPKNSLDLMNSRMESANIRQELRDAIRHCVEFHTSPAPGLLIGAFMTDYALELLGTSPEKEKIFGTCETPKCAPDALQVIAKCSTGNGRLKVVPIGKFAITVNGETRDTTARAVRVYIDLNKLKKFPVIDSWYANSPTYDKHTMDESLQAQIFRAGREILSYERVRVKVTPKAKWKPITCSRCGEPVPDYMAQGNLCGACSSMMYYEKI